MKIDTVDRIIKMLEDSSFKFNKGLLSKTNFRNALLQKDVSSNSFTKYMGYTNSSCFAKAMGRAVKDSSLPEKPKGANWLIFLIKLVDRCPVCDGEKKDLRNATCSTGCANTIFKSRENNPNWKGSNYRVICFDFHKKECIICGEDKIVEVHHYDENHENNGKENLIPLCPTHHQYFHSKYKELVIHKINLYKQSIVAT